MINAIAGLLGTALGALDRTRPVAALCRCHAHPLQTMPPPITERVAGYRQTATPPRLLHQEMIRQPPL